MNKIERIAAMLRGLDCPHADDDYNICRACATEAAEMIEAQAATIAEHPGNQAIAERIAEELFVNGAGQEAHRLVLTSRDGRDLGGWSKGPLTDRIVGVLASVPGEK